MAFGKINDNDIPNELDSKDDKCVNRNSNVDAEDDHSIKSLSSSASSEEQARVNQLSFSPTRKDQVRKSLNKRGLPPLPKERKKHSLDVYETETLNNQELEKN